MSGLDFSAGVAATRDHLCSIPRVDARALTPLQFLRTFVAPSRPCILLHATAGWPAHALWRRPGYLAAASGAARVTLSRTPTGRADARGACGRFFLPLNVGCSLGEALAALEGCGSAGGGGGGGGGAGARCGTPYLSAQDDSLRRECPALARDIGPVLAAQEALGGAPEAVNLWVAPPSAGARACAAPPVSSTHKDHYENLITVVAGAKTFTLLPPTDAAFLHVTRCAAVRYAHDDAACAGGGGGGASCSAWSAACEGQAAAAAAAQGVPWVAVDPDAPDLAAYPRFAHASPLRCVLREGETLYLPALWYHQVGVAPGEEGLTIAVNSWFEMAFGVPHVAQQMLVGLVGEA